MAEGRFVVSWSGLKAWVENDWGGWEAEMTKVGAEFAAYVAKQVGGRYDTYSARARVVVEGSGMYLYGDRRER